VGNELNHSRSRPEEYRQMWVQTDWPSPILMRNDWGVF